MIKRNAFKYDDWKITKDGRIKKRTKVEKKKKVKASYALCQT